MPVAGCDLSSRSIDIVLLDDDTDQAVWHRYPIAVKNGTAFEAARTVRGVLPSRGWWQDHGVYLLGIEDPFSRNLGTAKALGLITGALLACLPPELVIVRTPPQEWKRVFCGDARASKFIVAWKAGGRLDALGISNDRWAQDAYDAYGIAWAVRHLNETAITKGAAA